MRTFGGKSMCSQLLQIQCGIDTRVDLNSAFLLPNCRNRRPKSRDRCTFIFRGVLVVNEQIADRSCGRRGADGENEWFRGGDGVHGCSGYE
jgi:hypothetical protein